VYRGEWTRPCAIKKLRGLTRRRQLQDFYREAQILQSVPSPAHLLGLPECVGVRCVVVWGERVWAWGGGGE
jgi:hypothetical protein